MTHNPETDATGPDTPADSPRVLLTVDEAATALNIGRTTVYALLKTGEL